MRSLRVSSLRVSSLGPSSRPEEGEWDDTDTIRTAVRLRAGADHHRVDESVTDRVTQQYEMRIGVAHGCGQLDLDGEDAAVIAFDDQVDSVFTHVGP
ncbi:hypothetical protein BH23ACT8_BH23ACT8_10920 [soil metagenome]